MQDRNELITVIIPVYKVEKYLDRCMETVLSQTYSNLEIILVDDGSPDTCPQLCDEYAVKDARVKVIHKENGGLSDARNVAIDIAKGKYIGFVDSDDYIQNDMFEKLYCAAKEYNADIVICGHYVERKDTLSIEEKPYDEIVVYNSIEAQTELIKDINMKSYAWDKLYKAELFNGVRYPKGRNYEDIATTYLLYENSNRICRIPELLYYYQIREDSISFSNSDEKWYENCSAIVESCMERYNYYANKAEQDNSYIELKMLALAELLPNVYECIRVGYSISRKESLPYFKGILKDNAGTIEADSFISSKDKKLVKLYSANDMIYYGMRGLRNLSKSLNKIISHARNVQRQLKVSMKVIKNGNTDFALAPGEKYRILYFELPCFDNLGDHAIAYTTTTFLQNYVKRNPDYQLFVIHGWDMPKVIHLFKRNAHPEDIVICQGGGNMGSMYDFAETMRQKVLKTFASSRIIIMPQTVYFSQDEDGQRKKTKYCKVYNSCTNLTIFARDHQSYMMMKELYTVDIQEMTDIVASYDASEFASESRKGIILCLRSDAESAFRTEDKKLLYSLCRNVAENIHVTDTCTKEEIAEEYREMELHSKWSTFGKARLVVTDRLHGMIFSLITKTPCVVLGNNHHKVRETYNTLAKCDYLYYCSDISDAGKIISEAYNAPLPEKRTDFSTEYEKLEHAIAGTLKELN